MPMHSMGRFGQPWIVRSDHLPTVWLLDEAGDCVR